MKNRFRSIVDLGNELHGDVASADAYTFQSLKEHVDEVHGLLDAGDPHWKAETMDIVIHGYLLLGRHGVSDVETAQLMEKRLGRFADKISAALRNKGGADGQQDPGH